MNSINIVYKNKEYPIKFTNFDKLQMLRSGVAVTDFILPKEDEPLTKFLKALKYVVKSEKNYDWDNVDEVCEFINDFEDIYIVSGKILLALKRDGLIRLPDEIDINLDELENVEQKNVQAPQIEETSKTTKTTKKKQKKVS